MAAKRKPSLGIQQALWQMIVDRSFRKAVAAGKLTEALAKAEIELSKAEIAALSKIDPSDLEQVVAQFEQDITLVMGGSRPRSNINLSDSTIRELREVLDKMDKE